MKINDFSFPIETLQGPSTRDSTVLVQNTFSELTFERGLGSKISQISDLHVIVALTETKGIFSAVIYGLLRLIFLTPSDSIPLSGDQDSPLLAETAAEKILQSNGIAN